MEVHHHPEVRKKSFKEYLLEGLMIFIAVTMGFIAETIREGINEDHRAEAFAASMIKDLEGDTAQLRGYMVYYDYAKKNTDSLMQLLSSADPRQIPSGKLYWYGLFGGAHRPFVRNDATFEQMKSSGTLGYFKKGLARDVAEYDRLCRLVQASETNNREIYTQVRISRARIFLYQYNDIANSIYHQTTNRFDYGRIEGFMASNPPLLSYDKELFNQYVEMVRSRMMETADAGSALAAARKLIGELKEEYGD